MNFIKLFSLLSLAFLFVACGSESDTSQQGQESASANGERVIELAGLNSMKYAVDEETTGLTTGEAAAQEQDLLILESITAKPGETITIRLTTISTMPASAMAHNWILLTQDADPNAFANAAARAKENNYIPADMQNQMIAHTELAAGGETVEVTFTVPQETGDYEYLCSFPGHYAGGMRGILTVEE